MPSPGTSPSRWSTSRRSSSRRCSSPPSASDERGDLALAGWLFVERRNVRGQLGGAAPDGDDGPTDRPREEVRALGGHRALEVGREARRGDRFEREAATLEVGKRGAVVLDKHGKGRVAEHLTQVAGGGRERRPAGVGGVVSPPRPPSKSETTSKEVLAGGMPVRNTVAYIFPPGCTSGTIRAGGETPARSGGPAGEKPRTR